MRSFTYRIKRLQIEYEGDKKTRGTTNKVREVNFQSKKRTYEILQVFEFDSTRKRMSIILKDIQSGRIVMFCKGADSAVLKKCVSGNILSTEAAIKTFAHNGWRTLVLTYRELSQTEYDEYTRMLNSAYSNILERNKMIEQVYEEIESNLILIGATGIEDKLQEEVSETLETLRAAGIKLWVLTGDKIETAINISQSCGHFSDQMEKIYLINFVSPDEIKNDLISYSDL